MTICPSRWIIERPVRSLAVSLRFAAVATTLKPGEFILPGTVAMRYLSACTVIVCGLSTARAGDTALADARQRYLRGNYAEARALYEKVAQAPATKIAGAVGVVQTLLSEGEYDQALALLDTTLKTHPDSAPLHARRAEVLYLRGRWDDAQKAVHDSLKRDTEQFVAHWIQAQLYRDRGDLKKANDEFLWFVRTFAKRGDTLTPEETLLVGLAELERARGDKRLIDQFQVVLKDLFTPLFKKHKDF